MGHARLVRGDDNSVNVAQEVMSEINCDILTPQGKYEVMVSALKLDFNEMIEPIISKTNLNGYLTTNEIIEKIDLKAFISNKDDNTINNNAKVLSRILYTELLRLQMQWKRFAPTEPIQSLENLKLRLDGICYKILKICK